MKIINKDLNLILAEASHKPFVGFVSGPVRMICAIAQISLNLVATIFSIIPSALVFFDKESPIHIINLGSDCFIGGLHLWRGVIEFFPGSSFIIDMVADGRKIELICDHPFNGTVDTW